MVSVVEEPREAGDGGGGAAVKGQFVVELILVTASEKGRWTEKFSHADVGLEWRWPTHPPRSRPPHPARLALAMGGS